MMFFTKKYPIDLDDMVKKHRLITKHDSLLARVLGEERFNKANICFKSNNTLALINALENNTGIGIMPLSFALHGLVCLDNIICDCPITYHLYANRLTKDIPRVRTLINFYKDIMQKLENPVPIPSIKGEPLPILRQSGNKAS
ncbi:MAG: LysR substrate-binding domain-containing protein [Alphaproteobacteria bacterium]